ncbi:MAG: hypothetical protein DRI57_02605 [Deltaproteobacteria bacterium]|nr:MAG: hypothetical protein DRI57_02605 [Deltaproteobacteria bacterium]
MKRDIYRKLTDWKSSRTRKPLLLPKSPALRDVGNSAGLQARGDLPISREHFRPADFVSAKQERAQKWSRPMRNFLHFTFSSCSFFVNIDER